MTALRSLPALFASLFLLGVAAGCTSNSNIGNPCDKDDQCGGDLICDFHEGKGTCQEPHGHDTAGETEDTEHEHDTDEHEHTTAGSTEPTSSTTSTSTTEHEHGETEHEHTSTTAGTTSTG
jgi:hypothetical protein